MKAAISNITESAKRRDTIGRNRVSIIKDTQSFGIRLFDYQNVNSSDNVEKLSTVILYDESSQSTFILKYRVQIVTGDTTCISSEMDTNTTTKLFKQYLDELTHKKKGDENSVNK